MPINLPLWQRQNDLAQVPEEAPNTLRRETGDEWMDTLQCGEIWTNVQICLKQKTIYILLCTGTQ